MAGHQLMNQKQNSMISVKRWLVAKCLISRHLVCHLANPDTCTYITAILQASRMIKKTSSISQPPRKVYVTTSARAAVGDGGVFLPL